jgi:hypothetical protein
LNIRNGHAAVLVKSFGATLMFALRMQSIRIAGAREALRRLRKGALALHSRIETFCLVVGALFCLAAVGLLTVISLSVLGDNLSGR